MLLTLGECARQLGISKGTVSKAIKTGKLSATKREDHSFGIDPAELARYVEVNGHRFQKPAPIAQSETTGNAVNVQLELRIGDLKDQLNDMREQRDKWQTIAERLTLAPPAPVARRQWWSFRKAG